MKLKVLQLDLVWPKDVSVLELRKFIIAHLQTYGEPLRWAITVINNNNMPIGDERTNLSVEAVVIIAKGVEDEK